MSQEFHLSDLQRAFLVGVHASGKDKELCEEYLQELERLCDSYGLPVVGRIACPIKKIRSGNLFRKRKDRRDLRYMHRAKNRYCDL